MTFVYIFLGVILLILGITIFQLLIKACQKTAPELPSKVKDCKVSTTPQDMKNFVSVYNFLCGKNSGTIFFDEEIYNIVKNQADYVAHRFDCSDFRLLLMYKIYKDGYKNLDSKTKALIENTFINFKYSMDEEGDDSMCFWSENHQLIFAVMEYLAGCEWQEKVFPNNNMTGREHKEKAQNLISSWMKQRFDYGFSEYLSNNYFAEDIAPMSVFITYCSDEKLVSQMKIILDLLFLDVALNSVNNRFVSASSRMYANNKAGTYFGNSIQVPMNILWGQEMECKLSNDSSFSKDEIKKLHDLLEKEPNYISICFTDMMEKNLYDFPAAIKNIALSDKCTEVKMSCGLSPEDLKNNNLIGQQPHQIMAQFGAEAFTNPQVINNTVKYLKKNKMLTNSFVSYFKFLDILLLKPFNFGKFCAKHNLMPHGIALFRGNIYTYRTKHYALSTAMAQEVDTCGAQEHVWVANIASELTLFTTHPAFGDDKKFGSSPGYWIGNGRRPMSVQNNNVNITIYKLSEKIRLPETQLSKVTHAYFPKCFYDEVEERENIVFARKNSVFVALIMNGKYIFKPYNEKAVKPIYKTHPMEKEKDEYLIKGEFDLCRYEKNYHIYVTELSDSETETFEEFKKRIAENEICFGEADVTYKTKNSSMFVSYNGTYTLNGKEYVCNDMRYDCQYCKAERKAQEILIDDNVGNRYMLSFDKVLRQEI